VGSSFLDFLRRWASAFEAGSLAIQISPEGPRVDRTVKACPSDRWESVLREIAPLA
jgi:hypothetical protein